MLEYHKDMWMSGFYIIRKIRVISVFVVCFVFNRKMAASGVHIRRICFAVFCRVTWRKYSNQVKTLNRRPP